MAGRGTASSFADALQTLLSDVMTLGATPDADMDFVMQLRQTIMDRLSGGQQQPEVGSQAQAMPPGQGPNELSRGPMPSPDMTQMAQAGAPPGGGQ